MAGKGPQIRKGANLQKYWDNYPFSERMTVSQWKNKFGDENLDMSKFSDIPVGTRITENEYQKRVSFLEPLTEEEVEEFKKDMNSMNFSEFGKILNKSK